MSASIKHELDGVQWTPQENDGSHMRKRLYVYSSNNIAKERWADSMVINFRHPDACFKATASSSNFFNEKDCREPVHKKNAVALRLFCPKESTLQEPPSDRKHPQIHESSNKAGCLQKAKEKHHMVRWRKLGRDCAHEAAPLNQDDEHLTIVVMISTTSKYEKSNHRLGVG